MKDQLKQDVLKVFQKVSPSYIAIEDDEVLGKASLAIIFYVRKNLGALGDELDRILTLIVRKAETGIDCDLEQLNGVLLKGYNGFGTSYTIWYKPE